MHLILVRGIKGFVLAAMAVNLLINLEELGLTPRVRWHTGLSQRVPFVSLPRVLAPDHLAHAQSAVHCGANSPGNEASRTRGGGRAEKGGTWGEGKRGAQGGRGREGAFTAGRLPRLPPPYAPPVGVPTQVRPCRGHVTGLLHRTTFPKGHPRPAKVWILGRNHP